MKYLFKYKLSLIHVISVSIIFVVFVSSVLPLEAARAMAIGLSESIDTSFTYSVTDLYRIIEFYTPEIRLAYIYQRFSFDLIWPLVYGLFIVVLTAYLLQKINKDKTHYLIYFPILAVIFDFLENVSVAFLMFIYPIRVNFVAYLASITTTLKWIILTYSFIQIIALFIFLTINTIKKK